MDKVKILILSIIFCFPVFGKENKILNNNLNEGLIMDASVITTMNYISLLSKKEIYWKPVLEKKVMHNEMDAILFRFEQSDIINLYKTNLSILIDANNGELLGISRLLLEYKKGNSIPVSETTAKEKMIEFITVYSPRLLDNYKLQWIDEHDEKIYIDKNEITISGMKVKCKDLNTGLYFWVIVAPDNSVMVFEKEIEWDFIKAGRQTQKWLHDSYLERKIKDIL